MFKYTTPEKKGISSANIEKYLRKLEKRRLSTHDVIIMRGGEILFDTKLERLVMKDGLLTAIDMMRETGCGLVCLFGQQTQTTCRHEWAEVVEVLLGQTIYHHHYR